MLVVFGGLPGAGKTTIAQALAARRSATYLRIDVIEQAIRSTGVPSGDVGSLGYEVANALALSNLRIGRDVVADCVNPVEESRQGWRATAAHAHQRLLDIEVVCSDRIEHRRRIEERRSDINGLLLPTWEAVLQRHYVQWTAPHLVVDTARLSPEQAIAVVENHMAAQSDAVVT